MASNQIVHPAPNQFVAMYLWGISIFVIAFSYIQGAHNLDPHHWGLMLSNAKDLHEGALPYKNIFIQYGILTTFIHAQAFAIGGNMLSIILITSFFYAAGLVLIYYLSLHIFKNCILALYAVTIAFLFHPLAIYPWSNYIAFPFLILGIYYLIRSEQNDDHRVGYGLYGCGVFFGLAVLSREGLLLPVVTFILIAFVMDAFFYKNCVQIFFKYLKVGVGLLLPIFVFIGYLLSHDLVHYWLAFSLKLPAIYASESFSFLKNFIFEALFQEIYKGYRFLDIRWIVTSLIIFSCLWAIFVFVATRKVGDLYWSKRGSQIVLALFFLLAIATQLSETFKLTTRDQALIPFLFILFLCLIGISLSNLMGRMLPKKYYTPGLVKIAMASLLLLSSSLHLSEIFRIATASIVGVILLIAYLDAKSIVKPTFIFLAAWLGLTAIYGNRGNYFLPSVEALAHSEWVTTPPILRGQHWPKDAVDYYSNASRTLEQLHNDSCGAKYIINETRDAILTAMSPLKALQIAPFAVNASVSELRPEDEVLRKKTPQQQLVVLQSAPTSMDFKRINPPEQMHLIAHYPAPKQAFMPTNQELLIFASKDCLASHSN